MTTYDHPSVETHVYLMSRKRRMRSVDDELFDFFLITFPYINFFYPHTYSHNVQMQRSYCYSKL